QGVQDTIDRESKRNDFLRKINVYTNWLGKSDDSPADDEDVAGEMDDDKRDRLRKAITTKRTGRRPRGNVKRLAREHLRGIAAIDHVETMVPVIWQSASATVDYQYQDVSLFSAHPGDAECQRRIVAGRFFNAPDEKAVVVSELFLYHLLMTDQAA